MLAAHLLRPDAQGKATSFTYDARGNRTSSTDALSNVTTFAYDVMNRLTSITQPGNIATTFAYDTRGRRSSVTDANNKTTAYSYDDADRLLSVTDAASNSTIYGYDTENHLQAITDALGRVTSFAYDPLGRVTGVTFPSTFTESYTYDAVGNLTSKTDRKAQTISYAYDNLDRLVSKTYPDSTGVSYVYDALSRLTQASDPSGTYSFSYDHLGRLTGTTTNYSFLTGRTLTNSYTYDAASNRASFTDPEGGVTNYTYDTLNRLTNLKDFSNSNSTFSYDALGRRTSLARPNGVSTSYTYDSLSRLLSVLHQKGSTLVESAAYTYDAAGNRLSRAETTPGSHGTVVQKDAAYTYDAIYQVTQAAVNGNLTDNDTYDAVGNRLADWFGGSYSYNNSNELLSYPAYSWTYDNNGNTAAKTVSGSTTSFNWDFENRLTGVTLPGTGGTVTFKYDPFGRRIEKVSAGGTTIYAYDGDNVVEQLNSSGAATARYTQGLGIDEPLEVYEGGKSYYYHANGLGSVVALTKSTGSAANTYFGYNTFGAMPAPSETVANPYRFTGREWDSETSLYYYRARYYDPLFGRFLSEDPSQLQRGNSLYTYVSNDPANEVDPSGLAECFYRISSHTLECVSRANIKSPPIVVGPNSVSSGLGPCKDEPACKGLPFVGPIHPGEYRMNRDPRPGHEGFYRLEPQPIISGMEVDLGLARGGFLMHPGRRTLGCINVLKDDPKAMDQYRRMLDLLKDEDGMNYLLVAP